MLDIRSAPSEEFRDRPSLIRSDPLHHSRIPKCILVSLRDVFCFFLLNPQYKWLFLLCRQKFQLDSSGSFDDVFSVDFVPKLSLSVLQKNSLKRKTDRKQ